MPVNRFGRSIIALWPGVDFFNQLAVNLDFGLQRYIISPIEIRPHPMTIIPIAAHGCLGLGLQLMDSKIYT